MPKSTIIWIHSVFWVLFILNAGLVATSNSTFDLEFDWTLKKQDELGGIFYFRWYEAFFTLICMISFYINYFFVIPKFFYSKNIGRILVGVICTFASFITVRFIVEELLLLWFIGVTNYNQGVGPLFYIYDNLYYGSFSVFCCIIMWLYVHHLQVQKDYIQALEHKSKAEMSFLRSQINPHFMFNTLNNIYSLVYQRKDTALDAIEQLSELMRYVTYYSHKEQIALEKEIAYIQSYIELEELRFASKSNVVFTTDICDSSVLVFPLLFIPFVENIYKHALLDDTSFTTIIYLKQTSQKIVFKVENHFIQKQKDHKGGVGIDNIKKRLALFYPNTHSICIVKDKDKYTCEMQINL